MVKGDVLQGKKILVVDDEYDVLSTLEDLLDMADLVKASSFEDARAHLESTQFDLAVLDIMGVNGYELLGICTRRNITAVMLTAHALTPENIVKSFKLGAASFIPKDKIGNLAEFLRDILEAKQNGEHLSARWAAKLGDDYWEKKFGPRWKDKEQKFWKDFSEV